MDTAAFIIALAVFVVVAFWYLENEMKQSDGAHGLLAVEAAEKAKKVRAARYAQGADTPRYRPREKSAPVADLSPAGAPKYRRKERAWDRAAKRDEE
jgi:hypothetical protein